jgi:hypothetical protein
MTLNEAQSFFESFINETTNQSEIKIYTDFLDILTELKTRSFSKSEMQSIETKLDHLNLESPPENRKKHFRKALNKFKTYLKDTFSLTPKGYYTNLGIGLGSSFGIIFGIVILSSFERSLGIALGIPIGTAFGLIIGKSMDAQAEAAGNIF